MGLVSNIKKAAKKATSSVSKNAKALADAAKKKADEASAAAKKARDDAAAAAKRRADQASAAAKVTRDAAAAAVKAKAVAAGQAVSATAAKAKAAAIKQATPKLPSIPGLSSLGKTMGVAKVPSLAGVKGAVGNQFPDIGAPNVSVGGLKDALGGAFGTVASGVNKVAGRAQSIVGGLGPVLTGQTLSDALSSYAAPRVGGVAGDILQKGIGAIGAGGINTVRNDLNYFTDPRNLAQQLNPIASYSQVLTGSPEGFNYSPKKGSAPKEKTLISDPAIEAAVTPTTQAQVQAAPEAPVTEAQSPWIDTATQQYGGAVTVPGATSTSIAAPVSGAATGGGTLPPVGVAPSAPPPTATQSGAGTVGAGGTAGTTSTAAAGQGGIVSPMGLAGVGGTADQAKMMGTPAQQMGAGLGAREDTLKNQERYNKGARGATAAELQAQSTADKYKALGSLDGRVEAIVKARLAAPTQQSAKVIDSEKIRGTVLSGLDSAAQASLMPLVEAWAKDPSATNAATLQNALIAAKSPVQVNSALAPSLFVDAATATAGQAAAAVGPITMASLTPEDYQAIGFRDAADVATTLGLDPAKVLAMTPKEIAAAAALASKAATLPVEALSAQLNDPNVPEAQKEALREQLAGMGKVGLVSSAQKTAGEVAQASQTDSVDFLGEQVSLTSLLSGADPAINQFVANYLSTPNSAESVALKQKYPELAAWADANKQAILDAQAKAGEGLKAFEGITAANRAISTFGNVSLDESVMKSIVPSWGTAESGKYDTSTSGLLTWLKSEETKDPAVGAVLADAVNWAVKNGMSDAISDLNSLSPAALHKLFSGADDVPSKEEVVSVLNWRKAFTNMQNGQFAPADINALVAGPTGSLEGKTFDEILSTVNDRVKEGTASKEMISLRDVLDADKNGTVDAPTTVGPALKALLASQGFTGTNVLADLAKSNVSYGVSTGLKQSLAGVSDVSTLERQVFGQVNPSYGNMVDLVKNIPKESALLLIASYRDPLTGAVRDRDKFNLVYERAYPKPTPDFSTPAAYAVYNQAVKDWNKLAQEGGYSFSTGRVPSM